MQDHFAELEKSLIRFECDRPYQILGIHSKGNGEGFVLRTWYPKASKVEVADASTGKVIAKMKQANSSGLFELDVDSQDFRYRLHVHSGDQVRKIEDPYANNHLIHLNTTDFDYRRIQNNLGSHVYEVDGVKGVTFAVFAPNARSIAIVGEFNDWDGRSHPMQRGEHGYWSLFIPGLGEGTLYKYEIKNSEGHVLPLKADPFGFYAEQAPGNASIVYSHGKYQWHDDEWQKAQLEAPKQETPVTIYEVHLQSWRRHSDGSFYTYRQLADSLIPYVKDLGFTHIELLPVMEHPYDGSWGYQTVGNFAPTSRFGPPDDFKYFVDQCHQNGIGVILDWVPAHFPKDGHGIAYFDGSALYHEMDTRRGEHPDWGTLVYDYSRSHVRDYLISSALMWLEEFHADGIRVDAVASMLYLDYSREPGEWVPNQYGGNENLSAVDFLRYMNIVLHHERPGTLSVAEESTAWPMVSRPTDMGGLGFGFKWNMGWMHDTLSYMALDPIHRKYHHSQLSFGLVYAFNENFILPLSHDEVVHGKGSLIGQMSGDDWQRFANLRAYFGFMYGHPGKKLLFMGCEFAQWREWDFNSQLEWQSMEHPQHQGIHCLVKDLNKLYAREPSLFSQDMTPEGFEWVDFQDADSGMLAFVRKAKNSHEFVVVICNFTPVVRENYRLGIPASEYHGFKEIINTDSKHYGGSNVGNGGYIQVESVPSHGRNQSICFKVPPLATVILKSTA